jgi:hypothetical protein
MSLYLITCVAAVRTRMPVSVLCWRRGQTVVHMAVIMSGRGLLKHCGHWGPRNISMFIRCTLPPTGMSTPCSSSCTLLPQIEVSRPTPGVTRIRSNHGRKTKWKFWEHKINLRVSLSFNFLIFWKSWMTSSATSTSRALNWQINGNGKKSAGTLIRVTNFMC